MQKFKQFTIHEYDVDDKFALDSATIKHFMKGEVEEKEIGQPYAGPIHMVREIARVRAPIEKMKCLESLVQQV